MRRKQLLSFQSSDEIARKRLYLSPKAFTISSGSVTDSDSEVPSQRVFHGPYCIPTSLADQPCSSLGLPTLLDTLNEILGTSYTLSPPLSTLLEACIARNDDFGLAYARLRPYWHSASFATLQATLEDAESKDTNARLDALDVTGRQISTPYLPPRRVWDLWSNRVIPYWWHPEEDTKYRITPISHAWVAENERTGVMTSINGRAWPVPIPSDSSLESVRVELLNSGIKYAWLDVLCLRQRGEEDQDKIRLEEWKVDVPTIGCFYRPPWHWNGQHRIFVYFSGLGRPFRAEALDSPRHWLNRAWTVQETLDNMTIGGQVIPLTIPSFPAEPQQREDAYDAPGHQLAEFFRRFEQARLAAKSQNSESQAIKVMRQRSAVNELDRIAGLAPLLSCETIPIYDEKQSAEDAWAEMLKAMHAAARAHLLFWYPIGGDGHFCWAPSWSQLMAGSEEPPQPAADDEDLYTGWLSWEPNGKGFRSMHLVCDGVCVSGLGSAYSVMDYQGSDILSWRTHGRGAVVTATSAEGEQLTCQVRTPFEAVAVDESTVCSIVLGDRWGRPMVLGVRDDNGRFCKVMLVEPVDREGYASMRKCCRKRNVNFA